jgi:hypothetical protein
VSDHPVPEGADKIVIMAKRKKVGEISTGAVLGIGAAAVLGIYLLSRNSQPTPPVVVRPVASSSSGTTAAAIAAWNRVQKFCWPAGLRSVWGFGGGGRKAAPPINP